MGHFENRLAHIMLDKDMTIAELAEKTGRHRNTIGNLRDGTPTVRLETLAAVADALGVNPWEILVWVPEGYKMVERISHLTLVESATGRKLIDEKIVWEPGDGGGE